MTYRIDRPVLDGQPVDIQREPGVPRQSFQIVYPDSAILYVVADIKLEFQPGVIERRDRLRTVTLESLLQPGCSPRAALTVRELTFTESAYYAAARACIILGFFDGPGFTSGVQKRP